MATTTSSSSTSKNGLTPDIYDISTYVNTVKQEYTPDVDEDTLMLGIFGYFGSLMSDMFQNDIIMAAEFANESIATRAKFEKNVIAHALALNITTLNASPAKMDVLLTFIEDEIINAIGGGSGEFKLDCDNVIYFGNLEFHPDYDIIIRRIRLNNGTFTYTAMYDIPGTGSGVYDNPISDISNPYLSPPVVMKVRGTNYLFTACTIRQVEKKTIYKKVLSDNTIASKTVNFDFTSQMAAFDVNVINSSGTTHLVPVYEGLTASNSKYPYVWFTYLDSDTIRIKFDRDSYSPRVNSDVEIRLQTTQGNNGNFTWIDEYPLFSFDSDRLGYSNITVQVRPLTGISQYGTDKKTIDELKRIIPVEALSRGSITNKQDLYNFFNAIDTDNSQMYLYKKRDNNMERLYYTYIVMKDALANVIPTNTVNLMLRPDQLLFVDQNRSKLILKKGQIIRLDADKVTGYISRTADDEDIDYSDSFYYTIPYNFAINMDPMYGMYFLTTMDETKSLTFSYINEECLYQYIATAVDWKRNYLEEDDTYRLTIDVEQNIANDDTMITVDENGVIDSSNVRCFVVFYDENEVPYRYAEGKAIAYNATDKIVTFEFVMTSLDYVDAYNRIRIEGLTPTSSELSDFITYGYMEANCSAMIHIVTKQPEYSTDLNFIDKFNTKIDLSTLIKGLEGFCVSNSYTINGGINFFYDYSEIIYSTIKIGEGEYIPPDEEPTGPAYDGDYKVGGEHFEIPYSDKIIATELGTINELRSAFDEALGYMPKFHVFEDGSFWIEDADGVNTIAVNPVIDVNGKVQYVDDFLADQEKDPNSPEESLSIGKDKFTEPGSVKIIATELGVVNAVESCLVEILGYMPKFYLDENSKMYIEDGNTDVHTTIADADPNIDKDSENPGWDEHPYDYPSILPEEEEEDPDEPGGSEDPGEEPDEEAKEIVVIDTDDPKSLVDAINKQYAESTTNSIQTLNTTDGETEDTEEGNIGEEITEDDINNDPNYFNVGGNIIDPAHARANVLATELGAYNLIRTMLELVKESVPIIVDEGNGVVSITSTLSGSAVLGADGDDMDRINENYENQTGDGGSTTNPDTPSGGDSGESGDEGDDDDDPINPSITGDAVIPAPDGIGFVVTEEEAKKYHFIIDDVPVIKADYFKTEEMVQFFCAELVRRKNYIDEALTRIEDTFGINFKFVNTYGPSRLFTLNNSDEYINRVNLTLTFRIGLKVNYDENILTYIKDDIKTFIEDINSIDSIHMSNLVTEITSKYSDSIQFFEFVDMNGYGPSEQHLYSMPMPDNVITPELINVHTLSDFSPDITIIIA